MKKLIAILLFVQFSQTAFSQQSNCEDFKIGTFICKSEGLPDILLTRTATEQIEMVENSNEEIRGRIDWISDCSYKFTFIKTPYQNLIGKTILIELFDIKNNSAKGKVWIEGATLEFYTEKIN